MSATIGKVYVDAVITDERYKECMALVHEANERIDELRELVKRLRECTRHNTCAVCEYADDACDFDYDMRELGIEVDG